MCVPKRAILAPLMLPETVDSDEVEGGNHAITLAITHQQHTSIESLLGTKQVLSAKFMY